MIPARVALTNSAASEVALNRCYSRPWKDCVEHCKATVCVGLGLP